MVWLGEEKRGHSASGGELRTVKVESVSILTLCERGREGGEERKERKLTLKDLSALRFWLKRLEPHLGSCAPVRSLRCMQLCAFVNTALFFLSQAACGCT